LIKNVTDANDKGKYECRAQRGTDNGMDSIEVMTFTGKINNFVYFYHFTLIILLLLLVPYQREFKLTLRPSVCPSVRLSEQTFWV
jgi:hypothetical protein